MNLFQQKIYPSFNSPHISVLRWGIGTASLSVAASTPTTAQELRLSDRLIRLMGTVDDTYRF